MLQFYLDDAMVARTSHSTFHGNALLVRVPFEERDSKSFWPREVIGSMAISDPALVLAKRHVEAPVKRVFNVPVATDSFGKLFGIHLQRTDRYGYVLLSRRGQA